MINTKKESSQSKENNSKDTTSALTQRMVSQNLSAKSLKETGQQKSLSMNVAEHLLSLMKDVTKDNVNPQSVNAACNCATQMINLMKLNIKLRDL